MKVNMALSLTMDSEGPSPRFAARRFLETSRRHWPLVLIPLILLPVIALGVVYSSKPTATVGSSVWISQAATPQFGYVAYGASPAVAAAAEMNQLLTTTKFDHAVAVASPLYWQMAQTKPYHNIWIVKDLSGHVSVIPKGSNLLAISYKAKDAAIGLQVVNAILAQGSLEIRA